MSNSVSSIISDDIFANSSGINTPISTSSQKYEASSLRDELLTLKRQGILTCHDSGDKQGINYIDNGRISSPGSSQKKGVTEISPKGMLSSKSSLIQSGHELSASVILADIDEKITLVDDSDKSILELSLEGSENCLASEVASINILNSTKKRIIKNWLSSVPLDSTVKLPIESSPSRKSQGINRGSSCLKKVTPLIFPSKCINNNSGPENVLVHNKENESNGTALTGELNKMLDYEHSPNVLEVRKLSLNANLANIKKEEQENPSKVVGHYNLRRNKREGKENLNENAGDLSTKVSTNSTLSKHKISYRKKKKVKICSGKSDKEDYMSNIINSVMSTKLSSDDESFSSIRRKGVIRGLTYNDNRDSSSKHSTCNNSNLFTPKRKLFFRKPLDNSLDDDIPFEDPCEELSLTNAAVTSTPMPKAGRLKDLCKILNQSLNSPVKNAEKYNNKSDSTKQAGDMSSNFASNPNKPSIHTPKNQTPDKNNQGKTDSIIIHMEISPIPTKQDLDSTNVMRKSEFSSIVESQRTGQNSLKSTLPDDLRTKSISVSSDKNGGCSVNKVSTEYQESKVYSDDTNINYLKENVVQSSTEKNLETHNFDSVIYSKTERSLIDGNKFEGDIYQETTQNNMSYSCSSLPSTDCSDSEGVNDFYKKETNAKEPEEMMDLSGSPVSKKSITENISFCSAKHENRDESDRNSLGFVTYENSKNIEDDSYNKDIDRFNSIKNRHESFASQRSKNSLEYSKNIIEQCKQVNFNTNIDESLASIDSILCINYEEFDKQNNCSLNETTAKCKNVEDCKEESLSKKQHFDPSKLNATSQEGSLSIRDDLCNQHTLFISEENEKMAEKQCSMTLSNNSGDNQMSRINTPFSAEKSIFDSSIGFLMSVHSGTTHDINENSFYSRKSGIDSVSIHNTINKSRLENFSLTASKKSFSSSVQEKEKKFDSTEQFPSGADQNITVVISDNDDSFSCILRSKAPIKKNHLNSSEEEPFGENIRGSDDMMVDEPLLKNSSDECAPEVLINEGNNNSTNKTSISMEQNIVTIVLSDNDDSFSRICRSKTPKKKNLLNYSMEGDVIEIRDFDDSFVKKPTKRFKNKGSHDKYDPDVLLYKEHHSSFSSDAESPDICHEIVDSSNANDSSEDSSSESGNKEAPWVDLATYLKRNVPATSLLLDSHPKSLKKNLSNVILPYHSSSPAHTSFLLSLNESVPEEMCHPDAVKYREGFGTHKNYLIDLLFKLYNEEIFENKLPIIEIKWSGHLTTTSGITRSTSRITKSGKERTSVIKLSKTVVDNASKLRDVLIHELCHAANWLIDQQAGGHGPLFKKWADKVWLRFPEIPRVRVCHRYDLKWKYVYKCTYCGYEVGKMKLSIKEDTCRLCGGRVMVNS